MQELSLLRVHGKNSPSEVTFKTRKAAIVAAVLFVLPSIAAAAEFHVSPNGSPGGDGSTSRPWDLATALAQPAAVKPGDTIWLHGGTYRGSFTSRLRGATNAPIIVRQFQNERVIIDGAGSPANDTFYVDGAWAWYWGLEVTNSDTLRISSLSGSHPTDITRGTGIATVAPNTKFINNIIHDTGQGFGFWSTATDSEVYGNIIYNNGFDGTDRGHGHGVYSQNVTGQKRIVDNIMFNQFSHGIHFYGSSSAGLNNFYIEGNTSFNNGAASGMNGFQRNFLVGGGSVAQNPQLIDNYSYWNTTMPAAGNVIGYLAGCANPIIRGNFFHGELDVINCSNISMTGNTIWGPTAGFVQSSFPNNTYTREQPTSLNVYVRPNRYDSRRAHITIYNWPNSASVPVNLSQVLQPGDTFQIFDAQYVLGAPVVSGTYSGGTVNIPMGQAAIHQPIGGPKLVVHSPTDFGVFLVLKGGTGQAAPPPVSTPVTATPTIQPNGGSFTAAVSVSIAGPSGAAIRYTTNGTTPTSSSPLYTGAFPLSSSATVKAIATSAGMQDSAVASAAFQITIPPPTLPVAPAPAVSPNGGTFTGSTAVTLSSSTSGASIRYTLDGSTPTASSLLYSGPLTLTASGVLKAITIAAGMQNSAVTSASFTINAPSVGQPVPSNPGPSDPSIPSQGLRMWLRSDQGVMLVGQGVQQWRDQSGNGADATQMTASAQPTVVPSAVGGLPALKFDGAADFLNFTLPINGLTAMSVFVVSSNTGAPAAPNSTDVPAAIAWNGSSLVNATFLTPLQTTLRWNFGMTGSLPPSISRASVGTRFTVTNLFRSDIAERLVVDGTVMWADNTRSRIIGGATGTGFIGKGVGSPGTELEFAL